MTPNIGYTNVYFETRNFTPYGGGSNTIYPPSATMVVLSVSPPYEYCGCWYVNVCFGQPYSTDCSLERTMELENQVNDLSSRLYTEENNARWARQERIDCENIANICLNKIKYENY